MASIWDEALNENSTSSNEYPTIPAGIYDFEVVGVRGKEYEPKPGAKMKKCAEIIVQLRVEGKEREVMVFEHLYSDPIAVWKMTAFAKCIGVFETGMTPGKLLKKAEGGIGRADFRLREAANGFPARNEVKTFIEKKTEKKKLDFEELPF